MIQEVQHSATEANQVVNRLRETLMEMDGADRVDDRTFRVNFTGAGAEQLRERLKDKLKEFMGYTDDTLVEYVIVLLKNGRRKEEARNELNVFLGDNSYSFVSWLWDHLAFNLDLYVESQESNPDNVAKTKPKVGEQALASESDRGKSNKLSRRRHNMEWKGLIRDADEPPPFRSSVIDNVHVEDRTGDRVSCAKRSLSPRPTIQKKRSLPVEQHTKREVVSQTTISAPRRLLQFAVRDAVATSRPSKRLRSVVSTSTEKSSLEDHRRRVRSVARVPNAIGTGIKAVAEAAKGVKVRSSGNFFDRFGHGMDASQVSDEQREFREAAAEDLGDEDFSRIPEETHSTYLQGSGDTGRYVGNLMMLESNTGMASDSASDNEGYDCIDVMGHKSMDYSQTGTSGENQGEDSLMVQYSVANNANEIMRKPWKDQDHPASVANPSQKIVNISVNVNTWKPPNYPKPRQVQQIDIRKYVQETEAGAGKPVVQTMKESSSPVTVGNGNAKPASDVQKEPQKTLPPAPVAHSNGNPTEDADSRTIFVNNVHFAATKDSLSRHFNKFGEVLKVIILTDAVMGQPKGSAYVEFMRKEAAEHALSMDGISFMSRILKVTRKTSAHQEAAPMMTWSRFARGSPFAAPRFPRVPFPRGMPAVYRPRLPVKPGARCFQWKRDSQVILAEGGLLASSNSVPVHSPTGRSLTYVRTEPTKTNGNAGTA